MHTAIPTALMAVLALIIGTMLIKDCIRIMNRKDEYKDL